MTQVQSTKLMTHGEAGLALFFSASAFLCLIAAAKALDTAFAFHTSLGAAASLAAVFAIFNRYYDRPASLPPQEINGRPNYNLGPIKFAAAISQRLLTGKLTVRGAYLGHVRIWSSIL
jgi:cytochrome c oxidase cbb3-type subunit 1